jgi:hypothetical protein
MKFNNSKSSYQYDLQGINNIIVINWIYWYFRFVKKQNNQLGIKQDSVSFFLQPASVIHERITCCQFYRTEYKAK